jgi:hypothetical protein
MLKMNRALTNHSDRYLATVVPGFEFQILYMKKLIYSYNMHLEPGYRSRYSDWLRVGFRVLVGSRIFSSPSRPDRLWSPPNLLSNG